MAVLSGRRVAIVTAPSEFHDEELAEVRRHLEERGAAVTIASTNAETAVGSHGSRVRPDVLLEDVSSTDFEAIVFVGGPGAREYLRDRNALFVARQFAAAGTIVGALGTGVTILAQAGLLDCRRATCFDSERDTLEARGALLSDEPVVVDGNVVTAEGPASASEFAHALDLAMADDLATGTDG